MAKVLACVIAAIGMLVHSWPAVAMVGGAPQAAPAIARHVVLIVGSRGTSCTGVAIARDLVLTAAHCLLPGADYKLVRFDPGGVPVLLDTLEIARHPQFDLKTLHAHRATADVALLKLAAPLPGRFVPALLAVRPHSIAVGDRFVVAGYGVAVRGDGRTGGTVRAAMLVATGRPGSLQLRLVDPETKGERAGLGACTGDSGAPVFSPADGVPAVIGIVSWATGAKLAAGCGGLTGVTPLARYQGWVAKQARRMGSPVR
ncbi:MAG: trypsin-like serine protease [Xanthobacteraceae bacterium]